MKRTKWTERIFSFDIPEGWLPNVLERLHGTHLRIEELCSSLTEREAEFTHNGKWSIKDHVGHLSDLEYLHEGRIDDFIAKKETLRAADMSNRKTVEANHNDILLTHLISDFAAKRNEFIERLKKLDNKTQSFQSMHPRLNKLMRPVDMAFFTAEHDDHHIATMREIIRFQKHRLT